MRKNLINYNKEQIEKMAIQSDLISWYKFYQKSDEFDKLLKSKLVGYKECSEYEDVTQKKVD